MMFTNSSNSRQFAARFARGFCVLSTCALVLYFDTSIVVGQPLDSPRTPWTKSRIIGAPEPPAPYRLAPAFPKLRFERPTCLEELSGTNRLLVTEMGGQVFTFDKRPEASEKELVVDLRALLPKELAAKGVSLFDAELHPKFRDNRHLYLCYVHPAGHTRVSRFTLTAKESPVVVPDSEVVIITWPSGGHNAGCLEFGVDGFLYIATGDGSGPNPPDGLTTGQDVSDLLGAILRIDVDRPTGKQAYSIPADNPFVGQKGARGEIWAYGLRNPWKFGVDTKSGDIFAADNGWESWEMVHRIVRGGNCGWPVMEGRAALRTEVKTGPTPILPPVKDHSHTEANSVIGGPVYRGEKLPGLAGSFVYGDYITGTIWSVRREQDDTYSHQTLVDTDQRIVAFTQGSQGELFVLDYDFTGQIYELLPSNVKDTSATFPRKLSETGLFTSLQEKTLTPAPGVEHYNVLIERWMDGADGQRWVAIPGNGQISFPKKGQNEHTIYPEGTVFVKQISLPTHDGRESLRLETQLLHYENGSWRPYSYLWDAAGQDAVLVESIGKNRTLKVADERAKEVLTERTWHVNAVNECKLCHNAESKYVLGFTPWQLNRLVGVKKQRRQMDDLTSRGIVNKRPELAENDPLRLVDPGSSASLDDRARSYLHVNCGMCHQPGGNAIVGFFLRRDLPLDKLNTNRGTGIGTFGMRDAKIIAPADPYRSVLMYRMSKLGYARMPYIGSQVVDSAGVALIEEWIRSLPAAEGAGPTSGPATKDSAEAKAVQVLLSMAPTVEQRGEAVRELAKTTEGSLALVAQMHRQRSPYEPDTIDIQAAAKLGAASPANTRGLFETFLPESQRRATLGSSVDPKAILSRAGDAGRGKLIFYSDGARCRACHDIDDRNLSLGPSLREIGKKYPTAAELVQHVLQPALKIEEPFATFTARTSDGQVLSGMIVENTPREVVLKTVERKLIRLDRANIEELKKGEKSLMPEALLADLTAQEAADLIEFIRTLKAAK